MRDFWRASFVCPLIGLAATVAILGGCAANSGVVSLGADRFMVSRQGSYRVLWSRDTQGGRSSRGGTVLRQEGKAVYVLKTTESEPLYVLGNFPRAEVEFMCLDPSDPKLNKQPGS